MSSEINVFLKVLQKVGYPNPNLETVANMVDYDLDNFLVDLKNEIGESGVLDFCKKAIQKISGEDGIEIDLGYGEFCNIHVHPEYYDEEESENDVISTHQWGNSRLLTTDDDGNEIYVTIEKLIDDTDMGGWGELDELIDHIKMKAYNHINKNCGFGVWWE
jgi:hypothetical protein